MPQTPQIRYGAQNPYPAKWSRSHAPTSRREWQREVNPQSKVIARFLEAKDPTSSTQEQFNKLVTEWRKQTSMQSVLMKKVMHPAYQRIIGMGPVAIPLILRDMMERPGHWFWALDAITQGVNPAASCESLSDATKAWIQWGEEKGLL